MDDFQRLKQKLTKLRQQERGAARTLRGSAARLLAGIVTELDETILPRRVTFRTDKGVELHFAMANRRLQALLEPAPAAENAARLVGAALKDVEDPNLASLARILDVVLGKAEALTILTARQSGQPFPSDIGVPAAQLRKAWEIAEPDDSESGGAAELEAFLDALDGGATAWIRIDGEEIAAQSGDTAAIARLGDGAAVFLDGYLARKEKVFGTEGPPLSLAYGAKGSGAALFIQAGESMAFLLAGEADLPGLVTAWQRRIVR